MASTVSAEICIHTKIRSKPFMFIFQIAMRTVVGARVGVWGHVEFPDPSSGGSLCRCRLLEKVLSLFLDSSDDF